MRIHSNPELSLTIPIVSAGTINTMNILGDLGYAAAAQVLDQATPSAAPATTGTERNAWVNGANYGQARRIAVVSGGNGATDAGVVGLRVSGTTWDPATGTRTASQSETLFADITAAALNQVALTTAYFIGAVTFELFTVSGSPTTFNLSFNYHSISPFIFNGRNVMITGIHAEIEANAAITTMALMLFPLNGTPTHTYSAAGFSPNVATDKQWWNITEDDLAAASNKAVIHEQNMTYVVNGANPTGARHGLMVAYDSADTIKSGHVTLFYRHTG